MQTISIPDMKDMISHIGVRHRHPLMFWGQPGLGKSAGCEQACEEHGGFLVTVMLGQYDSVDLRGFPGVDPNTDTTVWHAPATLPFKGNRAFEQYKDRLIFLFLDEINNATQAVNAVAMQLLDKRRIGEHELMDNVVMVAAGNRETDRGVANRMPTTNANRLVHAEVGLDVNAWCYWFSATNHPAAALFVAFMQFRKPLLSTFEDALKNGHKAFASPRTWVKSADYFADQLMPENIKQAGMAGAIGDGPAAELWGFSDVWQKMPKMTDIVANPTTVPTPEEAAMRYAVAVAISGTMNTKNITPLCTYLERMDPEFGVLAWQLAMRRDVTISGTQECINFSKKYRAIFAR
jgi:hypothetical protein